MLCCCELRQDNPGKWEPALSRSIAYWSDSVKPDASSWSLRSPVLWKWLLWPTPAVRFGTSRLNDPWSCTRADLRLYLMSSVVRGRVQDDERMVADEEWLARPAFLTPEDRQNPYLHSWRLFFKHLLWPMPAVSERTSTATDGR